MLFLWPLKPTAQKLPVEKCHPRSSPTLDWHETPDQRESHSRSFQQLAKMKTLTSILLLYFQVFFKNRNTSLPLPETAPSATYISLLSPGPDPALMLAHRSLLFSMRRKGTWPIPSSHLFHDPSYPDRRLASADPLIIKNTKRFIPSTLYV